MKKFLATALVVFVVALTAYCAQFSPAQTTSTMMNLESNQTVTGEKLFVNFLGLPACNATPPTGSCTSTDVCFDTLGGLHTCPAGAWLQPIMGLTESDITGTVRTFTAKQSFAGGTDFTSASKQSTMFLADPLNFTCSKLEDTLSYPMLMMGGYFLCEDGDVSTNFEHHAIGAKIRGTHFYSNIAQFMGTIFLRHPKSLTVGLARDYFDPNNPVSDGQCPSEAPGGTACSPNGDHCDALVNTAIYTCTAGVWRIFEAIPIASAMDTNRGYFDRGGCTTQFLDRPPEGDICWDNTNKTAWWQTGGDDLNIPVAIPVGGMNITTEVGNPLNMNTQSRTRSTSMSINFQSEEFDFTCDDTDTVQETSCDFTAPVQIGLKRFRRRSLASGPDALAGHGTLADVTMSSIIGARPDYGTDCIATGPNCATSLWMYYRPMKDATTHTTWGDVTGDSEMEDALYMNRGIVFTGVDLVPDYSINSIIANGADLVEDPWVDPNSPFTFSDNGFETWFLPVEPAKDAIVSLPNDTGTIALRNESFLSQLILGPDNGDVFLWFRAPYDLTITGFNCLAIGGTSILVDLREADADGASSVSILSSTPACLSGTNVPITINDGGIDAGDYVEWNFGTEVGTVAAVTLTIQYTKDD